MFAYGAKTGSEQKIKFFVKLLYTKVCGFQRQSLWALVATFGRLPQKAKLFIVQALIGRTREPFCKRKGSRKPIESRVRPQKLSGG